MAIYMVTTLGAFGCAPDAAQRRGGRKNRRSSGLSQTNPWMAFALAAMMFSLAGIPPLAGFFGEVLRVRRGDQCGTRGSGGDRGRCERRRRLLLYPDCQDHVFRRTEAWLRPRRGDRRRCRSPVYDIRRVLSLRRRHCSMPPPQRRGRCSDVLRIGQSAERAGFRWIHKASVVSTMDEAGAAARAGDADRVWFTSDEQTGGRGRHGRSWASPKGNLYSTLFLSDPCRPHFAPQLGFVAGLALRNR